MLNRKWEGRTNIEYKDDIIMLHKPEEKNFSVYYIYPIVLVIVFAFLLSRSRQNVNEVGNVGEQARANGYNYEIHNVTTKDGYVLEIERIHKEDFAGGKNKVVLLGHGMSQIGAAWLCKGPQKSLGYNLADDDYDVWILNVRANSVSKYHTTISPTSQEYWDHTWHQMGIYDLPATIDYIIQATKVQQIDYVGFSMGTTIYFVLLSEYPNYANKFRRVAALAPAVYGTDLATTYPLIYYYLIVLQKFTYLTSTFMAEIIPGASCENGDFTWHMHCMVLESLRYERYDQNINQNELPMLLLNSTGTFSSTVVHHFYQISSTNEFRKFDYGKEINVKVYGREYPPFYNLQNVKPPMAVIYSEGDTTCTPRGVEKLRTELPNVEIFHKIEKDGFTHASFHLADAAKEEVYDRIIDYFR